VLVRRVAARAGQEQLGRPLTGDERALGLALLLRHRIAKRAEVGAGAALLRAAATVSAEHVLHPIALLAVTVARRPLSQQRASAAAQALRQPSDGWGAPSAAHQFAAAIEVDRDLPLKSIYIDAAGRGI
jgi:hypothetical protein